MRNCFQSSLRAALLSAEARLRAKADATKQSSLLRRGAKAGLLPPSLIELRRTSRGACHGARVRATRWLAMTTGYSFAFPRRNASELCMNFPPLEGVGNAGCRCTRSRACSVVNTRVSHHRSTGTSRHSRTQWFYGLFRALPGDRALLPPSSAELLPPT